ncbi:MAG TPA: MDR family MFS transporter [Savagea sp.]
MKRTIRPLVLVSVMIAMFVSAVEATIVTTAMPSIAADLESFTRYSWVFSSYLLMSTISVLIYGKLADIYGRKRIFTIGMLIFLLGSLLSGFATSMMELTAYRFIQGLGAGALMPIATTIIGDIYSLEERAKIQGYLSSVWGISAIVGPAIGGWIVHYWSWPFIFWINVPLGLFAMLGVLLFLHEDVAKKEVNVDRKGAFYSGLFLAALIVWLVEGGQSFGYWSAAGIGLLGIAAIFLLLFIRAERQAGEPLIDLNVWGHRTIFYANVVSFFTGIVLMAISSYLPTYVTGVMEQHAMIAGFTLSAMSLGWPLASTIAGHLLLKVGPFRTSLYGGGALLVGALLFVGMSPSNGPIWAGVASFWIGVGMGLTTTAFVVTIQNSVSYEERGSATASNMFMRNLGNVIGASLFGAILNGRLRRELTNPDDVQVLLTEETRVALSPFQRQELQIILHDSMHIVFLGVLLLVICSIAFIFKLPRGKVVEHDSNRT